MLHKVGNETLVKISVSFKCTICKWMLWEWVYLHSESKVWAQTLSCRSRGVKKQILQLSQTKTVALAHLGIPSWDQLMLRGNRLTGGRHSGFKWEWEAPDTYIFWGDWFKWVVSYQKPFSLLKKFHEKSWKSSILCACKGKSTTRETFIQNKLSLNSSWYTWRTIATNTNLYLVEL